MSDARERLRKRQEERRSLSKREECLHLAIDALAAKPDLLKAETGNADKSAEQIIRIAKRFEEYL